MKEKGQSITEIAIIVALVVIAAVLVLTLLGGQTKNLYGHSSENVSGFKPFAKDNASDKSLADKLDYTVFESDYGKIDKDGNGNVSITLPSGKVIAGLTPKFLDQVQSNMVKTTGAGGTNLFLKSLETMAAQYEAANPEATSVPINMAMGSGKWVDPETKLSGSGTSTAYNIRIEDKMLLVYKETEGFPKEIGTVVIPGTVQGDKFYAETFYQNVDTSDPANMFNPTHAVGPFTGKVIAGGSKVVGEFTPKVKGGITSTLTLDLPTTFSAASTKNNSTSSSKPTTEANDKIKTEKINDNNSNNKPGTVKNNKTHNDNSAL